MMGGPLSDSLNGIGFPYSGDRYRKDFGDQYNPPAQFEHAVEYTVAEMGEFVDGSEGRKVIVKECRWPATFFTLECPAGANWKGEPLPAITLGFGSGQGSIAWELAKLISIGMLSIEVQQP